jgi:hypothetical protein
MAHAPLIEHQRTGGTQAFGLHRLPARWMVAARRSAEYQSGNGGRIDPSPYQAFAW